MKHDHRKKNLWYLSSLFGVQVAYQGISRGCRCYASEESLREVLSDLGEGIGSSDADIVNSIRKKQRKLATHFVEPVIVAWDGRCPELVLKVREDSVSSICCGTLITESGDVESVEFRLSDLPVISSEDSEGEQYLALRYVVPHALAYGYHRLVLEYNRRTYETWVFSAPARTWSPLDTMSNRIWGAFLPLYALETEHTMGSGDYSSLVGLIDTVSGWGGNLVGTLPLLPVFLDESFDPSPYSPVSRLAWNEFYIDPCRVPEFTSSPKIRDIYESDRMQQEIEELRGKRLVDYRGVMSAKSHLLKEMSRCMAQNPARLAEMEGFARNNTDVEDYARFRAVTGTRQESWQSWPESLRNGSIKPGDYDEELYRYYLYTQWIADEQVKEVASHAADKGVTLYFDLPLGANRDGYDVWRYHHLFAGGSSTGAPPDAMFTSGQNWGFPPLHPEQIRQDGYRYFRRYLCHHLLYAGRLRIDHVMGFHRLFWIPRGLSAADGVYVRYRAEEFYAVLAIESHRAHSIIIGEDLGNVPGYVRKSMSRHGLHRMFIVSYELSDTAGKGLGSIPARMIAGMNTHDMAPFATFWKGDDIDRRRELGLLTEEQAVKERKDRVRIRSVLVDFLRHRGFLAATTEDVRLILNACLCYLAEENETTMLVNLEDLWLETSPQNIPGTASEYPNWRRKARYRLEEMKALPEVRDMLENIDCLRKRT